MSNPFDAVLGMVEDSMRTAARGIDRMAEDQPPFDSQKLSDAEEDVMYDNPVAFFPDAIDPATGVPLTNAQAAQMLLQEKGAAEYVRWVNEIQARRMKGGMLNG